MAVRTWHMALLCLLLLNASGCALWHDLQPHRLHHLNRVPPPTLDPEFSQNAPHDGQPLFAMETGAPTPVIRAQSPQNAH